MQKLVITVTVDSTMSYPNNHYCPPTDDVKAVSKQYIEAVKAGASIAHIHGVHKLENSFAEDGKKLSHVDFEGWRALKELIQEGCDPLIQFGIASARFEDKVKLMDLKPDMMSICFNAHDEYFHPDPNFPPNEIYAIHPRDELERYAKAAMDKGVKVEVESFHTGAFYNITKVSEKGLLPKPIWTTLFLGWPGGTWTPPTPKALINLVDHLPENANWSTSVMDPLCHWQILTMAIILGGHVRVGWEDNPYIEPGKFARSNAELVDKIVNLSQQLGREIATPKEARAIMTGEV